MRPYFAKVSIGTGFEPVLNWFQSTALIAQLVYLVKYLCERINVYINEAVATEHIGLKIMRGNDDSRDSLF